MKLKTIVIYILIFVLCFGLTACGDGISNKNLQKILRENGYNYESAKAETILDLNSDGFIWSTLSSQDRLGSCRQ